MNSIDIIKTANSNLLRSKVRTLLTVVAIFIGSFTLTLTTALGEGINDYIDKQVGAVSVKDVVQVFPAGFDNPFADGVKEYDGNGGKNVTATILTKKDKEKIEKISGVKEVYLINQFVVDYIAQNDSSKKYTFSQVTATLENLELPLAAGTLPKKDDTGYVLLANSYLEPLGFSKAEDAIGKKVLIGYKNQAGETSTKQLTITGVLINSLAGQMNRISFQDSENISKFQFGDVDTSSIAIAVLEKNTPADKVNSIKSQIKDAGYLARTFEDDIEDIKTVISYAQIAMSIFAAIAIVAAAIGIINTLFMSVYERTREIGLMKALGMKSTGVFAIFAFEAASIGFWGGLLGVGAGVLIGQGANFLLSQQFGKAFEGFNLLAFPLGAIIPIILSTMMIGLIAGALPALKASRLNPIDALRYE